MLKQGGKTLTMAVLLLGVSLQSCMTVFNARKVHVTAQNEDVTIYKNNEEISFSSKAETKTLSKPYVFGVDKEGYRRKNIVVEPDKFNYKYLYNFIPLAISPLIGGGSDDESESDGLGSSDIVGIGAGLTAYGLIYDLTNIGTLKHHSKLIELPELEPLPTNEFKDKKFIVDQAIVDLEAGDISVKTFKNEKSRKKDKNVNQDFNEDDFQNINLQLRSDLNEQLTEMAFADTTDSFFPDYSNSMKIDCTIDEIEVDLVYKKRYVEARLYTSWSLKNYYGDTILVRDITGKSNPFSIQEDADVVLDDGLEDALLQFITDTELKEEVSSSENDAISIYENLDEITLPTPVKNLNSVNDIVSATVTVKYEQGHGSGLMISPVGHVVTNYHVVSNKTELQVLLNDGSEVEAEVIRTDPNYDLALLKLYTSKKDLPSLEVTSIDDVPLGEDVFAIGTPSDVSLGQTLSKGIISGSRTYHERDFIQTDVKISPGNSGGPLVTKDGRLLGLVSNKVIGEGVEGIGFAIPATYISERLKFKY